VSCFATACPMQQPLVADLRKEMFEGLVSAAQVNDPTSRTCVLNLLGELAAIERDFHSETIINNRMPVVVDKNILVDGAPRCAATARLPATRERRPSRSATRAKRAASSSACRSHLRPRVCRAANRRAQAMGAIHSVLTGVSDIAPQFVAYVKVDQHAAQPMTDGTRRKF
jgi:hypothetical protein